MTLPHIDTELGWSLDNLRVPEPGVSGYNYEAADQPYHIEVWVEKSTMDDVLQPICQRWGVNYVTSLGFQSITSVVSMLKRIAALGKPARILYISDFDPAGDGMPVAVARQIEYWAQQFAPDQPIKLQPIALRREHVEQYNLPTIPVKDSDLRMANFERRYGIAGAVELDALEALHPGRMADLVQDAILPYRDRGLNRRLQETAADAESEARSAWADVTADEQATLTDLATTARRVFDSYQERLNELSRALDEELGPLADGLYDVRLSLQRKREEFAPDLPERPEPKTPEVDESGWLLSTDRDYLDQLDSYRARKAGEEFSE